MDRFPIDNWKNHDCQLFQESKNSRSRNSSSFIFLTPDLTFVDFYNNYYEKVLVLCEKWLVIFIKSRRFEKKWFLRRCLSVYLSSSVVVVVCKHDNFRRIYQIGFGFGTLLEGTKRKDEFIKQPFFSTVLVLSIKNGFLKINNSIFPPKYTRYGKTVGK